MTVKVVLEPGDILIVELASTDGKFVLNYGEDEFSIFADEADSEGRGDTIYSDRFGDAASRLLGPDEDALNDGYERNTDGGA